MWILNDRPNCLAFPVLPVLSHSGLTWPQQPYSSIFGEKASKGLAKGVQHLSATVIDLPLFSKRIRKSPAEARCAENLSGQLESLAPLLFKVRHNKKPSAACLLALPKPVARDHSFQRLGISVLSQE